MSLAYWGARADALDGYRILYVPGRSVPCGDGREGQECGGTTDRGESTIALALERMDCPEYAALPHEIGHAVAGDHNHASDRWRGFDPLFLTVMLAHPSCAQWLPAAPLLSDALPLLDYWNHLPGP